MNYPLGPKCLIFRIDVDLAGVGGVDRAVGDEGDVGDQRALSDEMVERKVNCGPWQLSNGNSKFSWINY
jgi:hypothetical protein